MSCLDGMCYPCAMFTFVYLLLQPGSFKVASRAKLIFGSPEDAGLELQAEIEDVKSWDASNDALVTLDLNKSKWEIAVMIISRSAFCTCLYLLIAQIIPTLANRL